MTATSDVYLSETTTLEGGFSSKKFQHLCFTHYLIVYLFNNHICVSHIICSCIYSITIVVVIKQIHNQMLYVMLCCYVMLYVICYVMLCCVMLCYVMLRYVTLRYFILFYVMLCYVMLCCMQCRIFCNIVTLI